MIRDVHLLCKDAPRLPLLCAIHDPLDAFEGSCICDSCFQAVHHTEFLHAEEETDFKAVADVHGNNGEGSRCNQHKKSTKCRGPYVTKESQ